MRTSATMDATIKNETRRDIVIPPFQTADSMEGHTGSRQKREFRAGPLIAAARSIDQLLTRKLVLSNLAMVLFCHHENSASCRSRVAIVELFYGVARQVRHSGTVRNACHASLS